MQWKILQHNTADDFVISTGKQYSVKYFVIKCCEYLGIKQWVGKGLNEKGVVIKVNKQKTLSLK